MLNERSGPTARSKLLDILLLSLSLPFFLFLLCSVCAALQWLLQGPQGRDCVRLSNRCLALFPVPYAAREEKEREREGGRENGAGERWRYEPTASIVYSLAENSLDE